MNPTFYELSERRQCSVRLYNSIVRNCSKVYQKHPDKKPKDVTIGDLAENYSVAEIAKFRNMGKTTIAELSSLFKDYGYEFDKAWFFPTIGRGIQDTNMTFALTTTSLAELISSLAFYQQQFNEVIKEQDSYTSTSYAKISGKDKLIEDIFKVREMLDRLESEVLI